MSGFTVGGYSLPGMSSQTDQELLRDYTEHRSESAFAELVRRHIDFVYSAARRMVGDQHLAEDVTQEVFLVLAQNAETLADHPVISGWMHRTAKNLASNKIRSDARRRARERKAAAMNEFSSAEPEVWERIAPHLDTALEELSEPDRNALLLRHFERKSAREIGHVLGISEEAAQKRVHRAVERLRLSFAKQGITVGASGLSILISSNAIQAAPAGLCAAITIARASAAATTFCATTSATATQAIAMTTIQKTLCATTILLALGTGGYQAQRVFELKSDLKDLHRQYASISLEAETVRRAKDEATVLLDSLRGDNERFRRDTAELPKLRGEVARLRTDLQELVRSEATANHPGEMAMRGWLNRVAQLEEWLEQRPDARIPELQFVSEQDWLDVARDDLDTELHHRRALSELRHVAESKVGGKLQQALRTYFKDSGGEFPKDLSVLRPYLDVDLDEAILDRWQIFPAESVPSVSFGGEWVIAPKAPVDEVYDRRFVLAHNGFGRPDWLTPQIGGLLRPLHDAFRTANGRGVSNHTELLTFATTPEQQQALEKVIMRETVPPKW
jgi:RNA polymerase sigma factor (sigma-70 family)